jgi:hypothetical protein
VTQCLHAEERWDQISGFVYCTRCAKELRFQCPYSEPGESRCPEWRCDCFIENHPDSPLALHPEDFVVRWPVDVQLPPFNPPEGGLDPPVAP